ncbi:uncharacterized protein [Gossypium hirsutum]|uniref:Uncharacterized protein n=1 Tax=Gossypium hirsutum TaxID=3635 RepID=A0ABM3BWJ1_GOSHI|nr:uncharacterized protein LOC121230573 [Gossypium hirsutum]
MQWYLNASLFLPFEELQNLSLNRNFIAGCIVNQGLLPFNFIMSIYSKTLSPTLLIYYISLFLVGFERLSSKLDKLENLDLSENHFNDSILASLSELASLKSLNLKYNLFTELNPTNGKVNI